jgi:hypothetical protein
MNEIETKKKIALTAKAKINKANMYISQMIALNQPKEGVYIVAELRPLENIAERLDALFLSMNKIISQ